MDNTLVIVLILIAIIVVAAAAWFFYRKRTSEQLKNRFGPEYDRTVERASSREDAERELREREARVTRFKIVALRHEEARGYQTKWQAVQAQFVDEPKVAVSEANHLIQEVMGKRGYPVSEFEQSAADLSVQYPRVVENYRVACEIAERNKRGDADTEDLRRALVCYRSLFEELLEIKGGNAAGRNDGEVVRPSQPFGSRKPRNKRGMHA